MATGFYSLSGVTVAGGGTTLVATQTAAPGGAPDASNFLNLIGADGTDGTPSGALILGPAGQVGIVKNAVNATTLQLSKAWVGAAITGGAAEIILGINALPAGRLAALITQIVALRPLQKSNNLAEFAGDAVAQAAIIANLGIDALALLVDRAQSFNATKQTQGRRNLGLTAPSDQLVTAASVAAMRAALGANANGEAIFTGATAAGKDLAIAANLAAQKVLLGIEADTTGAVIGSAYAEYTANTDLSAVIPYDDTIPQSSEGTEVMSVSITPKSATNKLRARFSIWAGATGGQYLVAAALFNGSANAVLVSVGTVSSSGFLAQISGEYQYTPGSTSPVTISLRVGPSAGTIRLNGTPAGRAFGGASRCTLVVEEIKG